MLRKLACGLMALGILLASCQGETGQPASTPTYSPTPEAASPGPASNQPGVSIPYGRYTRFEQISIEQGLSQSVVNAILQDRRGFLWVGTDDGLNRYDGYTFKIYKPDIDDPASLSDASITCLLEDASGNIWIGTKLGGLNRYDPASGAFTRYLHDKDAPQGISSNFINALASDKNGLWVGTDKGLDHLDVASGEFTHYTFTEQAPGASSNSVRALLAHSNGQVWIGTSNGGLSVYDSSSGQFTHYKHDEHNPASLAGNRVLSLAEGHNGEVWAGTTNGLSRFHPDTQRFTHFHHESDNPGSLAGNMVSELLLDRTGTLWVGTENGLDRYEPHANQFAHYRNEPGETRSLSHNHVQALYEDARGVLWIGTFGGGLNKYNRQQDRFTYLRHNPKDSQSLSSDFVFAILPDRDGDVWIGTYGGGLNRFDAASGKFTHYRHDPDQPTSIRSDHIISLLLDSYSNLWIGTASGLDRFHPYNGSFSHYEILPEDEGQTDNLIVLSMMEDDKKNIWLGTNLGVYIFNRDDKTFEPFLLEDTDNPAGRELRGANAILQDGDGHIWIGTFANGLWRITPGGDARQYHGEPGEQRAIGSNSILSILQSRDGTLWVGTSGGGLGRYDAAADQFTHLTEKDGLPNNTIYGIVEDNDGNLWLSTNFGLSRYNPANGIFRNFTTSDGLQSNEFNQNAYARDWKGNLYFGGIGGLNIFKPQEIQDNPLPPQIALTSLSHEGMPPENPTTAETLQQVTLAWPDNSFEFEFSALAFEQPARNQYAYTLEGFDTDWIYLGSQRVGRYTNLPGGTYTLRLRASNSDGVWNQQGQAIIIEVIPPAWETWWFRAILVAAFGLAVTAGWRWRTKSIQNQNRELERLVALRTADLEKRTVEIEALYQADEKLLRSVTFKQVLQALVDVSVAILKADRSVIFVWDEDQNRISPFVGRGFLPETLQVLHFAPEEGKIGQALKTGQPAIVPALDPDSLRPDIAAAIRKENIQSFAHFPIVVDGRVVAIFNVAYTRPNALNKDAVRLFSALVNRAAMSIANMELFEQTKDLAVMEERNRLARDLHDSAKQKAFAALAQLGTANGIMKLKESGINPHLNEAETLIYEVIQELNFLIQEIYPIALQEKGLQTTLTEYIYEWENRNDIMVGLTFRQQHSLPLEIEQAVYRFIQEALANIARHSKASHAEVSLVYNTDLLQVLIADNGCGFDINQRGSGLGFRSMRERISSLRGTLQIQSAPGQGTRLIAELPIKTPVQEGQP